ncbi:hypothetical protein MHEC_28880 [Mycobacterium heckeshornense]|uniref:Uncharacterized protein n=1 Tax=Mycobacterium heckeshornense TaxID=110505 RepID=A0A7R7GUI8_9MYCO|nr:hypothetical protein MHEC_27460 [Mycobacterium heckeshornense]BCO36353.1 hypothetical protein MHEC_27860 [Mycobacterium heckeshornense]BCO36455.1 hypothetical protein MHEC_28880 [Mycobacterium heckeshornense]
MDLEGDAFAWALPVVVQVNAETIPADPLLIDEVWITVSGKIERIASGKPVSPSQQAMRMSRTPRLRRSMMTFCQNRAKAHGFARRCARWRLKYHEFGRRAVSTWSAR